MFRFNFVEGDVDDMVLESSGMHKEAQADRSLHPVSPVKFVELDLHELVDSLPPIISFSPLEIPVTGQSSKKITLIKRDLFDVRYQLIAQEDTTPLDTNHPLAAEERGKSELDFVDNPSDLVPAVYEGGLKTWECSLDVVDYLEGEMATGQRSPWARGRRILEIGCGTAVPSLYLLRSLFLCPDNDGEETTSFVLQDYNESVLRLVTLPNIFLTWYMSPLGKPFHETIEYANEHTKLSEAGELAITPELRSAFLASIKKQNMSLRIIAGSWDYMALQDDLFGSPFDLTMTSETIYRRDYLPSLIRVLRLASTTTTCVHKDGTLNSSMDDLPAVTKNLPTCLVAAKVLYFGVGGSVIDFGNAVRAQGGSINVVFEKKTGVGRQIINILWV